MLGIFFDKNWAFKSRLISNTFFLDFGSDLGRPDTQSDRAGSIQTHVGTFSIIYVFFGFYSIFGSKMSSILHFWKTFWPTVLTSKITSEKYPKKCKNKPKSYPLKVGIRTYLAPKIGTFGPKSPLGVSRASKWPNLSLRHPKTTKNRAQNQQKSHIFGRCWYHLPDICT